MPPAVQRKPQKVTKTKAYSWSWPKDWNAGSNSDVVETVEKNADVDSLRKATTHQDRRDDVADDIRSIEDMKERIRQRIAEAWAPVGGQPKRRDNTRGRVPKQAVPEEQSSLPLTNAGTAAAETPSRRARKTPCPITDVAGVESRATSQQPAEEPTTVAPEPARVDEIYGVRITRLPEARAKGIGGGTRKTAWTSGSRGRTVGRAEKLIDTAVQVQEDSGDASSVTVAPRLSVSEEALRREADLLEREVKVQERERQIRAEEQRLKQQSIERSNEVMPVADARTVFSSPVFSEASERRRDFETVSVGRNGHKRAVTVHKLSRSDSRFRAAERAELLKQAGELSGKRGTLTLGGIVEDFKRPEAAPVAAAPVEPTINQVEKHTNDAAIISAMRELEAISRSNSHSKEEKNKALDLVRDIMRNVQGMELSILAKDFKRD